MRVNWKMEQTPKRRWTSNYLTKEGEDTGMNFLPGSLFKRRRVFVRYFSKRTRFKRRRVVVK